MKSSRILLALAILAWVPQAGAADGLTMLKNPHGAKAAMDRFEDLAKQRGLNVIARNDHAAGAARIGRTPRATAAPIFGNPPDGTPFMECAQSVGLDLPPKALVWEDATGQAWLGYNEPAYLAARHKAATCPAMENLRKALGGLAEAALAR